jgi:glucose-1-phosphate thymidylyltransferase
VPDPHRFGIAEIENGRVISIEEKPTDPKSDCCVTGIYLYDASVFEIIDTVRPSGRGEMEISDVNARYLERGQLRYQFLEGWWSDAGTFESLRQANELIRGHHA